MTDQVLLKEICDRQGALDYADLTDIGCAAELICALDNGLNDLFYLAVCRGKKRVIAKTAVRRCKKTQCHGCDDLHLCKFYLLGECKNSRGRRRCPFGHDLHSEHNSRVLSENSLERLNRHELRQLLLQNDNSLIPPVCYSYNKGTGPYGNCPDQEECRRVHVCDRYIRGTCQSGADCYRCHDFFEPHPFKILQQRGVPNTLMSAMLSTYQNILAMKGEGASGHATISQAKGGPQRTGNTDICLFFVKGDCNQGEKCWRVHSKLPYKWEIKAGPTWLPLADNEAIEKDFCDPSKTLSEGSRSVCFDSMNCGSMEVRRLSTISSVLQPKYILTTNWAWFWKDEYNQWIKYASIKEMHRLSSITSDDLEAKYQEDPNAVVKFSADKQFYELSFKEMTQTNELYDTVRLVRRRPAFVSAAEAQTITRWKNGPRNNTQNVKAVPGFWDMSAIPDIGYKPVSLGGSDRDYQKVQGLFKKTMAGFHIIGIDRVQNRDLWEDFQRKRDRMKKNNGGKISKELTLFHGTDPKHIEDICRDNFDWRLCGTNGTVYGQGSYFARDAKYSHSYTGDSGVRSMFSCRVLVGNYTQGNSKLRRPPSKGEGNPSLYDSCVDNVRDPSIYVVFERHQVYPEFLIKYDDGATSFTPLLNLAQSVAATTRPKTVSIQSLTLTSSAALNPVVAPAPLSQMFSPYKTAATMTFYQTPSHPTSSSANQILPSAISHPSLTPMKPAPRSKLASTASNTVVLAGQCSRVTDMDSLALLYKVLSGHNGSFELGELRANMGIVEDDLESVLRNPEMFTSAVYKGKRMIVAKTKMRVCRAKGCNDCSNLHMCKFFLYGTCPSNDRHGCFLSHDLSSEHNSRALREHHLEGLDRRELCTLLLQNDNSLLPPVCVTYNKGGGRHGYCSDKDSCRRLHICQRYISGTCAAEGHCGRSHDFYEPQPLKTLQNSGVPNQLVATMLPTYSNIQAISDTNHMSDSAYGISKTPSVGRLPQSKALPGYWDKSSVPETGFKRVALQSSSDEYKKILDLFHLTMTGFSMKSIERVQNRILWDVFQWKGNAMRETGTENERHLFYGTDCKHVDAICLQNIDWRTEGIHGMPYGKGSYFSRDANYSHSYTSQSEFKSMFFCRVLVGNYTQGHPSYVRPSVSYDSYVDDVSNPAVFVVVEKHQVYPEYLIRHKPPLACPTIYS
ncbi:hypothetical protein DPEC_G00113270 [Dallia pectoralis]|uniref:Uncharacterized protein n=1 Tax=Dallia pectoralis TaxID=75939 RepID=A0ACC2GTT5_DALPE|nr:hypothetical protein DPEC_G00113270 [Dallia pectoralis]